MIDILKASTKNQNLINRLYFYAKKYLQITKPQNNNYLTFSNGTNRFTFNFRKCRADNLKEFYSLEFRFSPHYLFNNDLHNGNDFTPLEAIKTIKETFLNIGIMENELEDFKVVNLEYGLNLVPGLAIENLINGILYTKKTPLKIPDPDHQYSKISDSTKYKEIKAYAKGLQFADRPDFGIDKNTFRFEVRSKQSKNINMFGIFNVNDLLKLEVYSVLFQSLNDEWENVLIINLELKNEDNTPGFWSEILKDGYINKFRNERIKYYQNLDLKNNLHHLIKCKIIDKITTLSNCDYSTQGTPINKGMLLNEIAPPNRINLEYSQLPLKDEINNRLCKVTNLDITMQKKGSKFLGSTGLKFYKETDSETFKKLSAKYLTEKMRTRPIEKQIYYIAHNIRNEKYNRNHNPRNSRLRFERRNYPINQLQFSFGI